MRTKREARQYFFVDEAGDPNFYDTSGRSLIGTNGCSKILLLGFIKTERPVQLRHAIHHLRTTIASDPYLQGIPSLKKTLIAFHAKDDCAEVREKFYKMIINLPFTAEFIVARKIETIFQRRHKSKSSLFYHDLISKLFENKLHLATENYIYFATRGNKTRQEPLDDAIRAASNAFERKWRMTIDSRIQIFAQSPSGEPCLQIADYMNWAVQRAFQKGDDHYYKFVEEKVSFLVDIYDFARYPENFYNRKNPFLINKMSPL